LIWLQLQVYLYWAKFFYNIYFILLGAIFNDLSYYIAPDLHGEWYAECTTGTHKAVDRKTGVGAYCKAGASGCITPYGWVSNKWIEKKMNSFY